MEKNCPRCGDSFICCPENISDCQCASVGLDQLQRSYVKLHYQPECLCSSCLTEVKKYFYAFEVNPRYEHLKLKQEKAS